MKLKISAEKAIALLQERMRGLDAYNYDPKVWKDRTEADMRAIFPLGDTHWLNISQLKLDSYMDSDRGKVRREGKLTAKRQIESIIQFILDHDAIANESVREREELYEEKYLKILREWNDFVPRYNKMLATYNEYVETKEAEENRAKVNTLDKGNIKILFLGANPNDQTRLRIDREVREIDAGLRRANERDIFSLNQKWAVSPQDIQQAILDDTPDIIHFSGHGDTTGIVVEDALGNTRLVSGEALAELFSLFSDEIRCVILNSCFSLNQATEISKYIPYVIGMNQSVNDESAIQFSLGFYAALGAGKDIEFAFKMGIVNIKLAGISGADIPQLLIE